MATHQAPGKHFRKGLPLVKVMKMFPDDEAASAWIVNIRWTFFIVAQGPSLYSGTLVPMYTRFRTPFISEDF